ncbi:MAG: serine/threonine-protein kinase [Polyangiaceae bacterium]
MTSSAAAQGVIGPGSWVADYHIQGVLGVGGSGTVYRASKAMDDTVVALKVMNVEHADNDGERQRFAREAEIVKRLAHPHVVGLLDYGFHREGGDREIPFLVFPFLEGETLEKRIEREGALAWKLVGRFAEQALSALEMAHAMGIAHRDIKPANIFCCQGADGEVIRILDFGTAKITGDKQPQNNEVTRVGMLVGTPRYMAPEQARGEPLTPTADVYAFGLVMTEMLIGRPLVTGNTDFEIYVAQGSDKPHVLPDAVLDSPFATVIARAIAKPTEVRYRLASQMLADVRAIVQRFQQGESRPLEADLEATSFFGFEPVIEAPSESAQKLRTAFNAIANRAPASAPKPAPAPVPSPASQPAPQQPSPQGQPHPSFTEQQQPSPTSQPNASQAPPAQSYVQQQAQQQPSAQPPYAQPPYPQQPSRERYPAQPPYAHAQQPAQPYPQQPNPPPSSERHAQQQQQQVYAQQPYAQQSYMQQPYAAPPYAPAQAPQAAAPPPPLAVPVAAAAPVRSNAWFVWLLIGLAIVGGGIGAIVYFVLLRR